MNGYAFASICVIVFGVIALIVFAAVMKWRLHVKGPAGTELTFEEDSSVPQRLQIVDESLASSSGCEVEHDH